MILYHFFFIFSSKEEIIKEATVIYPQPDSPRKGWQKATNIEHLENKTICPQTLHQRTLKKAAQVVSPRKAWDLPHETIIKAFELADLSPSATQKSCDSDSKKQTMKRCDTFVVQKQHELAEEDEEDDEVDETDKPVFSPEKLATMKATKNLLLGVTLGQFDLKSTKMLRTCSEPDMTKLFDVDEDKDNDKDDKSVEKSGSSKGLGSTKKQESTLFKSTITNRLVKSLEDLAKSIDNCIGSHNSSQSDEDDDDSNDVIVGDGDDDDDDGGDEDDSDDLDEMVKLLESVKPVRNRKETEDDDDVSEVRDTMASLLASKCSKV